MKELVSVQFLDQINNIQFIAFKIGIAKPIVPNGNFGIIFFFHIKSKFCEFFISFLFGYKQASYKLEVEFHSEGINATVTM